MALVISVGVHGRGTTPHAHKSLSIYDEESKHRHSARTCSNQTDLNPFTGFIRELEREVRFDVSVKTSEDEALA